MPNESTMANKEMKYHCSNHQQWPICHKMNILVVMTMLCVRIFSFHCQRAKLRGALACAEAEESPKSAAHAAGNRGDFMLARN